jgi:hypothetical protein
VTGSGVSGVVIIDRYFYQAKSEISDDGALKYVFFGALSIV